MRVKFSVVGDTKPHNHPLVDLDAVPAVGQTVTLPGLSAGLQSVRTVVWYPFGDPDDATSVDPFVYVVVGPARTT